MSLHPDVALSVRLDAICGRSQYTRDPGSVIDEIRAVAGARTTIRDESIGTWVGYFREQHVERLCAALLDAFPGAAAHVPIGAARRSIAHSTAGY